jgi:hypothetical protein
MLYSVFYGYNVTSCCGSVAGTNAWKYAAIQL